MMIARSNLIAEVRIGYLARTGQGSSPYGVQPEHTAWTDLINPYSWMVKSEATKHPLANHCVPGDLRSMDAVFYEEFVGEGGDMTGDDDVYYTTHGPNLDSKDLGIVVGDTVTSMTWLDCMKECEVVRGCIGFR